MCFVSQPALSRPLAVFCAAHPLAKIEVESQLCSTELRRRPLEFELDAAIAQFDVEDGAGLHVVPFYEERHVVVASNNLLLSSDSAMRWVDAEQLPLALLTPDMRIRQ